MFIFNPYDIFLIYGISSGTHSGTHVEHMSNCVGMNDWLPETRKRPRLWSRLLDVRCTLRIKVWKAWFMPVVLDWGPLMYELGFSCRTPYAPTLLYDVDESDFEYYRENEPCEIATTVRTCSRFCVTTYSKETDIIAV